MKKYCIQPFNNIRIDSSNIINNTRYRPCCHYIQSDEYNDIESYLASSELSELQNHLLTKDTLPPGCKICNDAEVFGHETSTRLLHSRNIQILKETDIKVLEIFPGNICNLRCVMCDPNLSSSLSTEYKELGWLSKSVITDVGPQVLDDLSKFKSLKTVSIIGGEFFLSKSNLEILDVIIERRLQLRLTTNATSITKKHLLKLQQLEDNLDISISIDGITNVYEFIRYPAIWNKANTNISILKKSLPNASIQLNAVVQVLNIQFIDKLIDYANRKLIPIRLTPLITPDWLSWNILTRDETELINCLQTNIASINVTTNQTEAIKSFVSTIHGSTHDSELRISFIDKMAKILSHRKIPDKNIRTVFGILDNLADSIIDLKSIL